MVIMVCILFSAWVELARGLSRNMGVYVSSSTERVCGVSRASFTSFLPTWTSWFPGLSLSQSQVYACVYCNLRCGPLCCVHVHVERDVCLHFWPQGCWRLWRTVLSIQRGFCTSVILKRGKKMLPGSDAHVGWAAVRPIPFSPRDVSSVVE